MEMTKARAWRELNQAALRHNVKILQEALAPGCRLMAVVKADAYGHGAIPVARYLQAQGVEAFAVACLSEAAALREAGIEGKILILGYTPPQLAPELSRYRLIQTVADEAHGLALERQGIPLSVHLGLDTGMHRLGIPAEDRQALSHIYACKHLRIQGVFSHLCVADGTSARDIAFTRAQLDAFYAAVDWLRRHGMDPGEIHIQCSAGILQLPPQAQLAEEVRQCLRLGAGGDCPVWRCAGHFIRARRHAAASAVPPRQDCLGAHPPARPGRRLRAGISGRAADAVGHGDHRLWRRPAPVPAPAGRRSIAPRAAVPHGRTDVHGSAAGGCHRCG